MVAQATPLVSPNELTMPTITRPIDPLNPTLEKAAEIISGLVRDSSANERYYLSPSYH